MKREKFRDFLRRKVRILDGGITTHLQSSGPVAGLLPESLNLFDPGRVMKTHRAFLEAGAEILSTNTFGANRSGLARAGMKGRLREMNGEGVRLAREVAGDRALVGGVIGFQERSLSPGAGGTGSVRERYEEPLEGLLDSQPDLLILETFTDAQEAIRLVEMIRESTSVPVIAFLSEGRSGTGETDRMVSESLRELERRGADCVGINCSAGADSVVRILQFAAPLCRGPLAAKPSAGLPGGQGTVPIYPERAGTWSENLLGLNRVRLLGGCCGVSPEHIRVLKNQLD